MATSCGIVGRQTSEPSRSTGVTVTPPFPKAAPLWIRPMPSKMALLVALRRLSRMVASALPASCLACSRLPWMTPTAPSAEISRPSSAKTTALPRWRRPPTQSRHGARSDDMASGATEHKVDLDAGRGRALRVDLGHVDDAVQRLDVRRADGDAPGEALRAVDQLRALRRRHVGVAQLGRAGRGGRVVDQ